MQSRSSTSNPDLGPRPRYWLWVGILVLETVLVPCMGTHEVMCVIQTEFLEQCLTYPTLGAAIGSSSSTIFSWFSLLFDGACFPFSSKEECNGRRIFGALACLKMCLPSHLLHSLAWYVELWDESYFPSSFIPRSLTIQHCCWYVWNSSHSFLWPGLVSLGKPDIFALGLGSPLSSLIIWEGPWRDPWCVLVGWRLMFLHLDDICFPSLLFFSLELWLDRCLTLSVDLLSLFILSIPFSILFFNIIF